MSAFKQLFNLSSPAGANGKLTVLIFHRVLPVRDPLFPDEMDIGRFDTVCGWVASWFNVLALDDAVTRLRSGTLPARAACITFDDGYADNYRVALPILQRHALKATFFISTGFLDGGRMWNDTIIESIRACALPLLELSHLGLGDHTLSSQPQKIAAIHALVNQIKYRSVEDRVSLTDQLGAVAGSPLPDNLMMSSEEVRSLHASGMQIGAHTVNHPILARLSESQAHDEIASSKRVLESLLGEPVGLFAYPNGKPGEDYLPQTIDLVRRIGFDAAVSTQWGSSRMGDDMFQIRRFTPWDKSRTRFGGRLWLNLRGS